VTIRQPGEKRFWRWGKGVGGEISGFYYCRKRCLPARGKKKEREMFGERKGRGTTTWGVVQLVPFTFQPAWVFTRTSQTAKGKKDACYNDEKKQRSNITLGEGEEPNDHGFFSSINRGGDLFFHLLERGKSKEFREERMNRPKNCGEIKRKGAIFKHKTITTK